MKPLSIEIQNFGAITSVVVDLSTITCAAICGPNGAGKSTAFTIAPMFALFGMTKAGTGVDDMVRTGEKMATVTFDFEHHGNIWRVIRTRSTQGRGKSTLDLQRQSGKLWVSESGASISETQNKIVDLLGLDVDTFAASSMILQGDAGNFTKRPAGQRKAILSQILQLDQYESLQAKAREKASALNIEIERNKAKLDDINSKLQDKETFEKEQAQYEKNRQSLEEIIPLREENLKNLQIEVAKLDERMKKVDENSKQICTLKFQTAEKIEIQIKEKQRKKEAQKLLEQEADILAAAGEYEMIKNKITALQAKKDEQNLLASEAQRIKLELQGVVECIGKLDKDIVALENAAADQPQLIAGKEEYEAALHLQVDAQKKKEQYQKRMEVVKDIRYRIECMTANQTQQTDHAKKEIESLERKTQMLASAECVDIEHANCRFLKDALEAKKQIPLASADLAKKVADAAHELNKIKEDEAVARQALINTEYNPLAEAELEQKICQLKPQVEALIALEAKLPLLDNLKEQRTSQQGRQEDLEVRLKHLRESWKTLSDSIKELPELSENLIKLQPKAQLKNQLAAAAEINSTSTARIDGLAGEIQALTAQMKTLEEENKKDKNNISDIQEIRVCAETLQQTLQASRNDYTLLIGRIGAISASLASLAANEAVKKELLDAQVPLSHQIVQYKRLVKAFGQDGIPALIIENAVPELERIANDILSEMSGGRNFLRFETQKELKSKKAMTETLDIIVGDWAGERIYETYSGGEQLRIDFAIRFALAEMLARRAGSKVEWLTIDEGFGSQSDEFLPMVIEAVQNVARRFGLVLVISHVKAVQEAFAERIEFTPSKEDAAATYVRIA